MENQWNATADYKFYPQQPQGTQDDPNPAKRPRLEAQLPPECNDQEKYSPSTEASSTNTSDHANNEEVVQPYFTASQTNQLQQQAGYLQQWAAVAQYPAYQQQNPNELQMQQLQHNMYNQMMASGMIQTLNNTHTSDEDSGNGSMIHPIIEEPPNRIVFTTVPGRLSLLGQSRKIEVSLAEIQRRINAPECLNQSILSAILRKAKNKDGGNKLNADLRKYNINLASGKRKSVRNSAFTALVEAEATTLSKDFQDVSERHFPFDSFAYEFLRGITCFEDYQMKFVSLTYALNLLGNFMQILQFDRSPVATMDLNMPSMMHPDSQKDFTNFSLLTHGFGTPAHGGSWFTQSKCIKVVHEAVTDPQKFCTRIGRPLPDILANVMDFKARQQQHQQQLSQHNFSQFQGYQMQTPQRQPPKEDVNGGYNE